MAHFYSRTSFLIGLALGLILAVYFNNPASKGGKSRRKNIGPTPDLYNKWSNDRGLKRKQISWDQLRYSNKTFYTESEYLYDKVKLLCIILVGSPSNLAAAKDTWARGCNSINPILLTSRKKILPTKQVKDKSSWILLCNVINDLNISNFDWALIVRDTSFVITENLRYHVAPLNPTTKHYLGHAVKFWSTIYNSGDPGYVLSAGSVKIFQQHMGNGKCNEIGYWNKEDFYLGKYLAQMNITPASTLDDEGLSTFHPYNWYHVFYPGENYYRNSVFPVKCCSRRSIAFQAIEGDKMYTFNYLFYKLQVFISGRNGNRKFNDSVSDNQTYQHFLQDQNIHNISSEEYYRLWEDLINDPNSFAQNLKKEQLVDDYE